MVAGSALAASRRVSPARRTSDIVRTRFGPRMVAYGPVAIAEMVGLDIVEAILQQLQEASGDRFATLAGLAEGGREEAGHQDARWYFSYDETAVAALQAERDARYQRIIDAARRPEQRSPRPRG